MKNLKIKLCIILLIGLFLSPYTVGYADDNDTSKGEFQIDTDNDAPSFTLVFDSTSLITPLQDVVFWAIIEDIDNTSTELTVTLYYSDDSFVLNNVSQSMSYESSPSANNYRYNYTMTGQPAGTYYQYYYQVEDGYSIVKSGNPIYYDIQWDVSPTAGGGQKGGQPDEPTPADVVADEEGIKIKDINIQIALMTLIAIGLIIIGGRQYVKYRENKY